MADLSSNELQVIRQLLNDPEPTPEFEVEDIEASWEAANQSLYGALALLWNAKAAKLASKVNISSGPTRIDLGKKFDHAREMADRFLELAGGVDVLGAGAWTESVQMSNTDAFDPEYTEYTEP